MQPPQQKPRLLLPALGAVGILAGLGIAAYVLQAPALHSPNAAPVVPAHQKPSASAFVPSIYCAFDNITRSAIVVAFDFAVAFEKDGKPRFDERYVGIPGDTQTFGADHSPTWPFAHDEDGTPKITSPDGATVILLYGLKLGTPGVLLIEAGLRSNDYRNLDGQCRQANLVAR
jgi:hypothetical protein